MRPKLKLSVINNLRFELLSQRLTEIFITLEKNPAKMGWRRNNIMAGKINGKVLISHMRLKAFDKIQNI